MLGAAISKHTCELHFELLTSFAQLDVKNISHVKPGVGNLRPGGYMRPAQVLNVAREYSCSYGSCNARLTIRPPFLTFRHIEQ